jgi:lipopolysaccharide export system protein LptA
MHYVVSIVALLMLGHGAHAAAPTTTSRAPIEVSADALDVRQNDQLAVFSGNVIAKQGTTVLRANEMTVYYANAPQAQSSSKGGDGITKIIARGAVMVTRPGETASGDIGTYDTIADTIDLEGNVVLTREQNILKGSKMHYNLASGRSILTSGGQTTGGGRVRGLFVPGAEKQ